MFLLYHHPHQMLNSNCGFTCVGNINNIKIILVRQPLLFVVPLFLFSSTFFQFQVARLCGDANFCKPSKKGVM